MTALSTSRLGDFLSNLFETCVAIDSKLLEECDQAELNKFSFSGFLIMIITLLSAISSFYAFTDYLMPENPEHNLSWYLYGTLCIFLALCWSAIVFNLFRFFVVSVPTTDRTDWLSASNISALSVQLFFCLILALVLAFPIAILILNPQIENERISLQHATLRDVSMTVSFIDKHEANTNLLKAYEQLEKLKLDEKALQVRLNSVQRDENLFSEAQANLKSNQQNQETKLFEIKAIRKKIDEDFKKSLNQNRSLHLVGKARFIWQYDLPITIFIVLFIFIIYSSLIFSKFLNSRGAYEFLIQYENRKKWMKFGIIESRGPLYVDGELVRFYHFGAPDAIQSFERRRAEESKNTIHDQLKNDLVRKTSTANKVLNQMRQI
jgi:hypothetical protein